MDIAAWLHSLGLEQYEPAFRDHAVDADTLPRLTAGDLKELGVRAVGHRRKLLDAIARLQDSATDPAETAPPVLAERTSLLSEMSSPTTQDAERRHLTVMFCDLVGSTKLSRLLDPEEYREILASYQAVCAKAVAQYDGFVAKYMGDGVLAYFGYPHSHEDDASRAVRTGLAFVGEVARVTMPSGLDPLCVRVAIATGLVVVGDLIGSGSAREQSVAGETPNLAARLQTIAPPGAVIVSPSTRRLLGDEFDLEDRGLQNLKGFGEPVRTWRVRGVRAVESRYRARGAAVETLIGRSDELELILSRWEQARDGRGQSVLLSGEAGIGKSRMVAALVGRLQSATVQYQCSPYFRNTPLYPVSESMLQASGIQEDDTQDRRLIKLETLLSEATGDVVSISPVIATMLSIPTGGRYANAPHDPQRQKELTIEALIAYHVGRVQREPLLVVFEDVHWADPTTLEFLDVLIDRIPSTRILLVMTFRPEVATRWNGRPHVTTLPLARLTPAQSADLAQAVAGTEELPVDTLRQILDRTDGVPLFVEELTKAVLEKGNVTDGNNPADRTLLPTAIPTTLHDSLMARLDRLPAAKAVAQRAAVIGREFTCELLAAIEPQGASELGSALAQLAAAELIFPIGGPPHPGYAFKHALVRDAAYESLLKRRRQALHASIAAVLEQDYPSVVVGQPELIAHHLSEARLPDRAVIYWQRAADNASRRQAHQEAIAHCGRGLELTKQIEDRALRDEHELRLQVRLGNSAISARGFSAPEVGTALYRARELCAGSSDKAALHTILMGLFYYHANRAELRESEGLGLELLAFGDARGTRVAQVDAHKVLLNVRYKLAKFEEALQHFEQGLALYGEDPWTDVSIEHLDDPGPNLLMFGACTLWIMGYPKRAAQAVADAVARARRSGHHFTVAYTVFMTGHYAELMEDWDAVKKANEETTALTTEWGLSGLREHVPRRERLLAVAVNCDGEAMAWKRQHPQPGFARSLHDAILAKAFGLCGEPEEGLRIVEKSLRWSSQTGSRFYDAELLRTRANILLLMRLLDEAEHSYREAVELARSQSARMWELKAACGLARMLCHQSRKTEARECLAPIHAWFPKDVDTSELRWSRDILESLSRSTASAP